jgi:hypothetical protein
LEQMVIRCFQQVKDWDDLLTGEVTCVHSLSTKSGTMPLAEASRRARNRIQRVEAKRRRAARVNAGPPPATLL